MNQDADLDELRARLQYFCKRTLRKQVIEYIQYTERRALTVPFRPGDEERLYEGISPVSPARGHVLHSVPPADHDHPNLAQAARLFLLCHRGYVETLSARLIKLRQGASSEENVAEQLALSEEMEDEYLEEANGISVTAVLFRKRSRRSLRLTDRSWRQNSQNWSALVSGAQYRH